MLGCGNMAVAAAFQEQPGSAATADHDGAIVIAEHACSTAGQSDSSSDTASVSSHSCCKKSRTEATPTPPSTEARIATSVEFGPSSSGMMTDCPLAGSKAAVVTKTRGDGPHASQAVAHSYHPAPKSAEQPARLSATPLLPNRGHTYLRCCVFLI